jgi:hypothetical protein
LERKEGRISHSPLDFSRNGDEDPHKWKPAYNTQAPSGGNSSVDSTNGKHSFYQTIFNKTGKVQKLKKQIHNNVYLFGLPGEEPQKDYSTSVDRI